MSTNLKLDTDMLPQREQQFQAGVRHAPSKRAPIWSWTHTCSLKESANLKLDTYMLPQRERLFEAGHIHAPSKRAPIWSWTHTSSLKESANLKLDTYMPPQREHQLTQLLVLSRYVIRIHAWITFNDVSASRIRFESSTPTETSIKTD